MEKRKDALSAYVSKGRDLVVLDTKDWKTAKTFKAIMFHGEDWRQLSSGEFIDMAQTQENIKSDIRTKLQRHLALIGDCNAGKVKSAAVQCIMNFRAKGISL